MEMQERAGKLHEQVRVINGEEKLRELVVYISSKCQEDPGFGRVKLNKVLFHSDFRAYRRWRHPITGTPYRRLPQGPAPRYMVRVLDELHRTDALRTQIRMVGDKEQKRPIALRLPNLDYFSGKEIAMVDEVISELWGKTATAVSIESHGIQWSTRNHLDPMPYESALLSDDPVTADDVLRAKELVKGLGIIVS